MLKKVILTVAAIISIFNIMKATDMDIIGNAIDFVAEEHEVHYVVSIDFDGYCY